MQAQSATDVGKGSFGAARFLVRRIARQIRFKVEASPRQKHRIETLKVTDSGCAETEMSRAIRYTAAGLGTPWSPPSGVSQW